MVETQSKDTKKKPPARRLKSGGNRNRQLIVLGGILLILALVFLAVQLSKSNEPDIDNPKVLRLAKAMIPDWITVQLIPEEADSRRNELLEDFNNIVIHYVGNPGSTAAQNRSYFSNPGTEVNAHFIVGLDGEILQCLPLEEKSSATVERNRDTISIEVCHPDEEGKFSATTYDALLRLTAWLCIVSETDETDLIRHYDATGKLCPLYYVENEDAWEALKRDVGDEIDRQIAEMTGT